eukprot:1182114-Amphidinium_carterae.1
MSRSGKESQMLLSALACGGQVVLSNEPTTGRLPKAHHCEPHRWPSSSHQAREGLGQTMLWKHCFMPLTRAN